MIFNNFLIGAKFFTHKFVCKIFFLLGLFYKLKFYVDLKKLVIRWTIKNRKIKSKKNSRFQGVFCNKNKKV